MTLSYSSLISTPRFLGLPFDFANLVAAKRQIRAI